MLLWSTTTEDFQSTFVDLKSTQQKWTSGKKPNSFNEIVPDDTVRRLHGWINSDNPSTIG